MNQVTDAQVGEMMMAGQAAMLDRWKDVLEVGAKSVKVTGALKIGEGNGLHLDLRNAGFAPKGKRNVAGNGELWFDEYVLPKFAPRTILNEYAERVRYEAEMETACGLR
jgi:hypothetical protein